MSSFKKIDTKLFQKSGPVITPDFIYWKKLKAPVLVKEFGPIDYVDFSPIEPHYFAVTCSVRVQIYNPITKLVVKNLSRFRESAYGASFRNDGKLLCAGGEEGNVKLFDVASKSLLRLFEGHTAAVHRTFFINNKPQIVSFSDDKSVKVWDVPTEKAVVSYSEHDDYIRAGATSPVVPDIILSGGYDSVVKMYDTRSKDFVLNVNHGSPVESLLFMPSGGIFLSAGGTSIKIWDAIAGGKLLGCVSQHHKTITCLRLASDNKRLLSSSLDRHVKVYDVGTFQVVHTLDFPNSVLSLGISKNDDTLVAGMVDGLVSVSRREEEKAAVIEKKISYKYRANTHQTGVDSVIPEIKKNLQSKYDVCFRKFQYSKALDCVLQAYVMGKSPQATVAVIRELTRRKALHKAFAGRDEKSITQIVRFFATYLTDYRFTRILISAAHIFLDIYEDQIHTFSKPIYKKFHGLSNLLKKETKLVEELASLQGAIHMLLAGAAAVDQQKTIEHNEPHNLIPSEDAKKNLVVNLT